MSTQSEFNELLSSISVSQKNSHKINELRNCFNESHIEEFLEKLNEIDNIDDLLDSSQQAEGVTDQFIDFVSELIINQK